MCRTSIAIDRELEQAKVRVRMPAWKGKEGTVGWLRGHSDGVLEAAGETPPELVVHGGSIATKSALYE